MYFAKWQGLGNDFVLIETENAFVNKLSSFAQRLCDRHFGIGADGLVLLLPGEKEKLMMRIFNSDGSEAEMCGNALRCAAKYAYERGLVKVRVFGVETKAGVKVPEIILEGQQVTAVRVDMGNPILNREQIPVVGSPGSQVVEEVIEIKGEFLQFTAVSLGNPHCLIFVPSVKDAPVQTVGPLLEHHEFFPQRTNVEFIEVKSSDEILVRVWERGVGETLACGTGACASVVGGVLAGRVNSRVRVNLPGGQLLVEWAPNGHVYLTGPAEEVFRGVLSQEFRDNLE